MSMIPTPTPPLARAPKRALFLTAVICAAALMVDGHAVVDGTITLLDNYGDDAVDSIVRATDSVAHDAVDIATDVLENHGDDVVDSATSTMQARAGHAVDAASSALKNHGHDAVDAIEARAADAIDDAVDAAVGALDLPPAASTTAPAP